ncbi:MAG: efflux RND transporter periplasmic adaptor subunit [Paracoccaceae bacterium]|jgi:RND family efflux transporter MFP subunit|uniref:efflux RND transporter periplasmic adaptor subunit n=1 Tax=unclassified Seohaeicola TaxID=2641111 RepID=UPI00237BF555|nr:MULTISPECIES: efflux RND transporter periplasmic adaptor subunit [unclassified Seohaeicola]MDD9705869.1 efflux RND transporter periplasmic adaptor subunit [Seohaeicola sp. 4SK31]MDD9736157.1 efflux RND transporter periplasmic adaptor subunit [Seohaeicola sp. SP36]MDF1709983.1 efflux RND transporter periplasmic adaptor subunit [Paracoccaceae bacterium]MDM7969772.1 efflux RND transporter periplasmic adaptor subunit [Paracoccaceae bacterium]
MSLFKQTLLSLVALAVALAVWIVFVPSAQPVLDRLGVYRLLGMEPAAQAAQGAGGPAFGGGGPSKVVLDTVTEQVLSQRVSAIGDGRALRSVSVRAERTGSVRAVEVTSGQYVDAGAVMIRLEDRAEVIALERARLMLADAEDELRRLTQLGDSGAVTAVRIREAELAMQNARLAIRQAEVDLEQTVVTAPISGWLGLVEVEVGDRLSAQDIVGVLTDRSQITIDFRVPERVISGLEPGMPVELRSMSGVPVPLAGTLTAVDNIVDRASRTLRVQAVVENTGDSLREGMAFEVTMEFPGETYPSVDALAVQWSSQGSFVWLAREGKVQRVPVVIRQRNPDRVLVEGDLTAGDAVVIEGVQTLRPGSEVVPANEAAVARDAAPSAAQL